MKRETMMHSQKTPDPRLKLTLPEITKLISGTADGMFVIDPNGKILAWNASASKILGYSAEEVIGKPCYEIISGLDPSGNFFCFSKCAVMTMAKEDHLIQNYDTQVTTKENRKIWLNTSILLVQGKTESRPLIVHLFRHIASPNKVKNTVVEAASTPNRRKSFLLPEETPSSPGSLVSHSVKRPVLSHREIEVLVLVSRCLVAKEIASELKISTDTARSHIQHILKKLNAHSKLEAVMTAAKLGFFSRS